MTCLSSHWNHLENNPCFSGKCPCRGLLVMAVEDTSCGFAFVPHTPHTHVHISLLGSICFNCTILFLASFTSLREEVYIVYLDLLLVRSEYITSESNTILCRQSLMSNSLAMNTWADKSNKSSVCLRFIVSSVHETCFSKFSIDVFVWHPSLNWFIVAINILYSLVMDWQSGQGVSRYPPHDWWNNLIKVWLLVEFLTKIQVKYDKPTRAHMWKKRSNKCSINFI